MLNSFLTVLAFTFFSFISSSTTIKVEGTPYYIEQANAALNLMTEEERWFVITYTKLITENRPQQGAYIWDYTTSLRAVWAENSVWFASILIHEAQHHFDYQMCATVGGPNSEARALEKQAQFLDRVGENEFAAYLRSLIGEHGINFAQRYVNTSCERIYDVDTKEIKLRE